MEAVTHMVIQDLKGRERPATVPGGRLSDQAQAPEASVLIGPGHSHVLLEAIHHRCL